jgi:prepilin-type N-terminal cleavage/methylation domain-containing protein
MKRSAFTMVELIFVIVIIGILAGMAVPKFMGVKDQAKKATELSSASAVSAALEAIHSMWSTSDEDFDWNNDGVEDNISKDLSYHGYPYSLERRGDAIGALMRGSSKSSFKEQSGLISVNNITYRLYTAKASDPTTGVKYPSAKEGKDSESKPDKNDFWLYVIDANATGTTPCMMHSDKSKSWEVMSGDFILIDVNGTVPIDFSSSSLGIGFRIGCS